VISIVIIVPFLCPPSSRLLGTVYGEVVSYLSMFERNFTPWIPVILFFSIVYLIYKYRSKQTDESSDNDKGGKDIFNGNKCLLLDGLWGEGKTFYYTSQLQHSLLKPIYISCFASSKLELVSKLLSEKSFIFKFVALHEVFVRLLPNNWHSFMPRDRVVVFDDLERLHKSSCDNYLDLIGIIEYLKDKCSCRILLIANTHEITDDCFNSYMEKVVDDFIECPIIEKNKFKDILNPKDKDSDYALNICWEMYSEHSKNLRLLKTMYKSIVASKLHEFLEKSDKNAIKRKFQLSALKNSFERFQKVRAIAWKDRGLFLKVCEYRSRSVSNFMRYLSNEAVDQRDTKLEDELEEGFKRHKVKAKEFCRLVHEISNDISHDVSKGVYNAIMLGKTAYLTKTIQEPSLLYHLFMKSNDKIKGDLNNEPREIVKQIYIMIKEVLFNRKISIDGIDLTLKITLFMLIYENKYKQEPLTEENKKTLYDILFKATIADNNGSLDGACNLFQNILNRYEAFFSDDERFFESTWAIGALSKLSSRNDFNEAKGEILDKVKYEMQRIKEETLKISSSRQCSF